MLMGVLSWAVSESLDLQDLSCRVSNLSTQKLRVYEEQQPFRYSFLCTKCFDRYLINSLGEHHRGHGACQCRERKPGFVFFNRFK